MKKVLALVLSALMIMGLVSCGGSTKTTAAATTKAAEATTKAAEGTTAAAETTAAKADIEPCTVQYWTGERHDMAFTDEIIAKFNKENEYGITVEVNYVTENLKQMYEAAYQAQDAPAILTLNGGSVNSYVTYMENLEDWAKTDADYWANLDCENQKYPFDNWDPVSGKVICYYAALRTNSRVEYNVDLLKANGVTEIPSKLSDYIDLAAKLTKAGAGEYYGIGFTNSSPFGRFFGACVQWDGGCSSYDYVNGKYKFDDYKEAVIEGARFFNESIAYPDQTGVDNMRALFTEQKFVLWQNASQEVGVFGSQFPIDKFTWSVTAIPSVSGGEQKGLLSGTCMKGYGISNNVDDNQKKAAWEVIKYIQSMDSMLYYCDCGFDSPFTPAVAAKFDNTKESVGVMREFQNSANEAIFPSAPGAALTGDNYQKVFWDLMMSGKTGAELEKAVDDAIADLNTRYNEGLDANVKAGSSFRVVIKDWDPTKADFTNIQFLTE